VVRKEYNSLEQARSRASFTGMTGTPVTLGDHLPALEEERVELLRRIIPVADTHPMDLDAHVQDLDVVVVNLTVAREFEQWNVVDVFNTTDGERTTELDLSADLHLEPADSYLAFDYWRKEFLGLRRGVMSVELPPFGSALLCLRRCAGVPQVLSTSRHITQGAVDLESVAWDEKSRRLNALSATVAGDLYTVHLYAPEGYRPTGVEADCPAALAEVGLRVWTVRLDPARSGRCRWSVTFGL
jgi:hypothetical protein